MKKTYFLLLIFMSLGIMATAQVGIGTSSPSVSAILELKSSNKGLLFPRTSTSTRLTMTPVKGMMVYDTTLNRFFYGASSTWVEISVGQHINYWTRLQDTDNIYNNLPGNVAIGFWDAPYRLSVYGTIYVQEASKTTIRLRGVGTTTEARVLFELPSNAMDYNVTQFDNRLFISRTIGGAGFVNDFVIEPQSGYIGLGTADPETRLSINGGTDVGNTSGGYLQLGMDSTYNVGFDNNEIQGRNGAAVSRLVLNNGGGPVQIGNAIAPVGYSLAINGKAICEELKIQASSNWPDYVFKENYSLPTLAELSDFIATHHHLPNIPDAATIASDGIEVGDMQKRMMEKIEELTLYILQLEKKYTQLSAEMDDLKSKKQ